MIIEQISEYLGLSRDDVEDYAEKAPRSYKQYYIKKKKGGQRKISHPSKVTKSIQYAFIEVILQDLEVHECAAAYVRGVKSPLLVNATKHSKYAYSVRVDFRDFFHSIRPIDFIRVLERYPCYRNISDADRRFIVNSLFIKTGKDLYCLGIGAPSSPIISNVVMCDLDEQINKLAKSICSDSVYTRYADDLIFSSSVKGTCGRFCSDLFILIQNNSTPVLEINEEKTVFTSKACRRMVTGLNVCPDGKVSVGRSQKRYIKKLIFDLKSGLSLGDDEKKYLPGYLSYLLDVEPDYYNKLVIKYGAELMRKAISLNKS